MYTTRTPLRAENNGSTDLKNQNLQMIFLSHPYNHEETPVVNDRIRLARHMMCHFLNRGVWAESWIVSTHQSIKEGMLKEDAYCHWSDMLEKRIKNSSKLVVLCMPGWLESVDVNGEIEMARKHDVFVKYYTMTMMKNAIGYSQFENLQLS
mgnify:CR=1 FL=1